MTQDRIHVSRAGLARRRHGPRDRRGGARGDGDLRRGQRGHRPRPRALCFDTPARPRWSRPRSSSRRSWPRASRRARRSAARGIAPDFVVGHSVGEFAALGDVRSLSPQRGDRARARARPRDGRRGARTAGRDGGDSRSRRRGGRGPLPQDRERLAGELQLPGPDRRLRRVGRGRRVRRGGCARGRSARDPAQGLGRVPLAARRARRRSAAARDRARALQGPACAVHVDRDGEARGGALVPRAARRAADARRCASRRRRGG